MTIQQAFQTALQSHQAGRLAEAEALYRQILAAEPRHADAFHLLGVIAVQTGRNDLAVDLIGRAIALKPHDPEAYSNLGNALRDEGQLDEAIAAFRQAIALRPDYPEAHSNLGNALKDKGQFDEAIAAYHQAIALRPGYPEAHSNLGNVLKEKGQLDEAIAAYRQALALKPDYPEAHYNLGIALKDKGRLDEAIAAYRRAIALRSDLPEAHYNLGLVLHEKGQLNEALAAYRQAIALKPDYPEAHCKLGNTLKDKGHLEEAIAAFREAIVLKPNLLEACYNLGNALKNEGRLDEAIAAYRETIALKFDFPQAHNNLGNVLYEKRQLDEAIAAYRQAILLKPDYPEAHYNLGNAHYGKVQPDEAIAAFRQAIALDPNLPAARFELALALLGRGDFISGWEEFEWRWQLQDEGLAPRNFIQLRWDGGPLNEHAILLHAEQGLGDTLQFIRYAPLVAQRGGRVIVECQPELATFLAGVEGLAQIIPRGESLPAFDVHCPLMSLPLAFGTRLETIPADIPYLRADAQKAARWRERLAREKASSGETEALPGKPLRVGLVWAGASRPRQRKADRADQRRSMALSQFAPLAEVPGVVFVSLQKGRSAEQALTPPAGLRLLDWTAELQDFSDTAALVESLDLVISVDTSVVHLAGALGKPVWVLNRFDTCWRWLLDRADSPWYPTMRLFRQRTAGDWESVIAEVRAELQTLVQAPAE